MNFEEKLTGSLFGIAIGDAMGAPVEGWDSARIADKFGQWDYSGFIPAMPPRPTGKGDGRITDDTLMTEALIRAYLNKRDHLDAFGYRDFLLPEMTRTVVWLPERQKEEPIIDRLNTVEKYTLYRLISFGADPRMAGFGNAVNCAIAMFIMPTGAVNAGDPHGAYQEAAALSAAESHSYAIEGAAALAAAYAAALASQATVADVTAAALDVARDGTKGAIAAVLAATDPADDLPTWIGKVRKAFLPFDPPLPGGVLEDLPLMHVNSSHSTQLSIEEAPVALAVLKYGQGDFLRTVRAGVRYGRDCDSIAGMAGGLCGALLGAGALPKSLRTQSCTANRRNWDELGQQFASAVREIWAKDQHRHDQRQQALGSSPR